MAARLGLVAEHRGEFQSTDRAFRAVPAGARGVGNLRTVGETGWGLMLVAGRVGG